MSTPFRHSPLWRVESIPQEPEDPNVPMWKRAETAVAATLLLGSDEFVASLVVLTDLGGFGWIWVETGGILRPCRF